MNWNCSISHPTAQNEIGDEFLNQDIKSNAMRRQRPPNRDELMKMVRSYLYKIQKFPERISRYFWAQPVQYAGL